MSDECQECGMSMYPGTYHPYAACLMFKACKSSRVVSENLFAVLERGRSADSQQEMADLKRQLAEERERADALAESLANILPLARRAAWDSRAEKAIDACGAANAVLIDYRHHRSRENENSSDHRL